VAHPVAVENRSVNVSGLSGTASRTEASWGRNKAMATEAYCVKCREKREVKDPKDVTMKNGRNAIQGTCGVCGTKLFRMVGKKAAA
jgi:hypothetical protein